MAQFIDRTGAEQQVSIDMSLYRAAEDAGLSVSSYINQQYPTREQDASAFQQICASAGLFVREDRRNGIRATRLRDAIEGTGPCASGAVTNVRDAVPESRILYKAAILSTIEDKIGEDLTTAASALDRMVAVTDSIEGSEFRRAVLNFDEPEGARSMATAQLAPPRNMLTLTASDKALTVPSVALGIQWSDRAEQYVGLDIIAMSVARQIAVQRNEWANSSVLNLLYGDVDTQMAAIGTDASNFKYTFDYEAAAIKKITQNVWVKWLYDANYQQKINIDWIITDIDTALQLENREGRPVIVTDDGTSPRINVNERIANPVIPSNVNVFITMDPAWPAHTMLGLDSRYAIQRVNSLSANYSATEEDLIRRSRSMRWDSGSAIFRLFDMAFSVLYISQSDSEKHDNPVILS